MEEQLKKPGEIEPAKGALIVPRPSQPDPALRRLDPLVGTWEITGRTLGSNEDNIRGQVKIAWLPGNFFMEQRGHMTFMDAAIESLEIIGYDSATEL